METIFRFVLPTVRRTNGNIEQPKKTTLSKNVLIDRLKRKNGYLKRKLRDALADKHNMCLVIRGLKERLQEL
jgi:hypothetical protein